MLSPAMISAIVATLSSGVIADPRWPDSRCMSDISVGQLGTFQCDPPDP